MFIRAKELFCFSIGVYIISGTKLFSGVKSEAGKWKISKIPAILWFVWCKEIIYIYIYRERERGIDIDCCSVFQSRTTFSDHMVCSKPGFLVLHHLQRLLKFMSIESVMPSNYFILCRPLLLLPSIFPRVFSNGLVLHIRWPEYWNFSFIITPFSEYSGLIFFRIDWFSLYRWKA